MNTLGWTVLILFAAFNIALWGLGIWAVLYAGRSIVTFFRKVNKKLDQ